jgi:hypothetical protein
MPPTEGYVYRIIAPGSNSVYVGQSVEPLRRFRTHKYRRDNPALTSFLKKHSDAEIYFWPVLDMDAEEIADEQLCRDMGFHLLNCTPCGGKPPGMKKGGIHTAAARVKISAAQKGRKRSAETRARMSAAKMGHKVTPETGAKISMAKLGRPGHLVSPETRAKISAGLRLAWSSGRRA